MQDVKPERILAAWHHISIDNSFKHLGVSTSGLSPDEVSTRLKKYGVNRLPEVPKRSIFIRFVVHYHNILIYVLLGCAMVTAVLDYWVDTGMILAVVIANAIIGFV
jgi:magnesium-transporting ATPase (P-type)